MSGHEQQLIDVATGSGWELSSLPQLSGALQNYRARVQKVEAQINDGAWTGLAAETASAHLRAMAKTFENARDWVTKVSTVISGANTDIREYANRRLDALPSGDLPTAVWDAFSQGKFETLAGYGFSAVSKGPAGIAQLNAHFAAVREKAAADAAQAVQTMIQARAAEVKKLVEVGFDQVEPELPKQPGEGAERQGPSGPSTPGVSTGPGAPSPSGWTPPGSGVPGGTSGPDGSGPGGNGSGPGGQQPSGPGGSQGPNDPPSGGPDWPHVIADPPIVDPNRPGGDAPGSGDDPHWTDPGRRPSVDSSLDGSTVRSGLGAAGLGAAGLAAGAKLAGSGGGGGLGVGLGAVGPGGLGAAGGPAAGGGGLRGAAAAAGSGGSGASNASSNSSGSGRGARPGGMMMGGGGAGGAAEKKSPKSGLGGYIAPKLEDEGDGGPAARASRAGSRTTEE